MPDTFTVSKQGMRTASGSARWARTWPANSGCSKQTKVACFFREFTGLSRSAQTITRMPTSDLQSEAHGSSQRSYVSMAGEDFSMAMEDFLYTLERFYVSEQDPSSLLIRLWRQLTKCPRSSHPLRIHERTFGRVDALYITTPEIEERREDAAEEWTGQRLAAALLGADTSKDMPHIRELILLAEDTEFTPAESGKLAPWLLQFAETHRESNDPEDAPVVWAAIRTGASMLGPSEAERLVALLEPGHTIETSLVAVKMVGRVFEAQPPNEVDAYPRLAERVKEMADSLLNRHAIASSECAAKAMLATVALAAIASTEILCVARDVRDLRAPWFTRRTQRKLRELGEAWRLRIEDSDNKPIALLKETLDTLEQA